MSDDFNDDVRIVASVMYHMLSFKPDEVFVLPGTTNLKEVKVWFGESQGVCIVMVVERTDLGIEPGYFVFDAALDPLLRIEIVGDFLTSARLAVQTIFICLDHRPREVYVATGTTDITSFTVMLGRSDDEMCPREVRVIERNEGITRGYMMFTEPGGFGEEYRS